MKNEKWKMKIDCATPKRDEKDKNSCRLWGSPKKTLWVLFANLSLNTFGWVRTKQNKAKQNKKQKQVKPFSMMEMTPQPKLLACSKTRHVKVKSKFRFVKWVSS